MAALGKKNSGVGSVSNEVSDEIEMAGLVDDEGDEHESADSSVTAAQLLNLIESQDYRCALTGWELEPSTAFIDHIQPLSKGGSHSLENLQAVHQIVNIAKGVLTQEEFVRMCIAVASGPFGNNSKIS